MKGSIKIDPFSQIVFISESIRTSKNLNLNVLVTITSDNFTFLGHVFVDDFRFDKDAEIFSNVYKPTNYLNPFLLNVNLNDASFDSLQEITKGKMLSMTIDLFINEDFYNRFSWKRINNFCRRSLLGKTMGEGYMCDVRYIECGVLLGVDGLYTTSIKSSNMYAIVNKDTEICINKIISTSLHLEQNSIYHSIDFTSSLFTSLSFFIKCSYTEVQSFLLWGPANSDKTAIIKSLSKLFTAQLISFKVTLYAHTFSDFKIKFKSLIKSAKNLSKKHLCFIVLEDVDCLRLNVHGRVALKYIQEKIEGFSRIFNGGQMVVFVTSTDAVECALKLTHEFYVTLPSKDEKKKMIKKILTKVNEYENNLRKIEDGCDGNKSEIDISDISESGDNNHFKSKNIDIDHHKNVYLNYNELKNNNNDNLNNDKRDDNEDDNNDKRYDNEDDNNDKRYDNNKDDDDNEELAGKCGGMGRNEIEALVTEAMIQNKMEGKRKVVEVCDLLRGLGGCKGIRGVEMIRRKMKVVGYEEQRMQILQALTWPTIYKETYKRMGLKGERGILLHGPPGCGKTCLIQQTASEARFSMVHVASADVYSPFLGDSEKNLRRTFMQAAASAPCIIFIDELDSMVGCRKGMRGGNGGSGNGGVGGGEKGGVGSGEGDGRKISKGQIGGRKGGNKDTKEGDDNEVDKEDGFDSDEGEGDLCSGSAGGSVQQRILTELLTHLDGVNNRDDDEARVILLACTNRLNTIDPALLRRFDRLIHLPPPSSTMRKQIFTHYTQNLIPEQTIITKSENDTESDLKINASSSFNSSLTSTHSLPPSSLQLEYLVEQTDSFTGADIENVCKQAYMKSLTHNEELKMHHFKEVLSSITPSSQYLY